MTFKIPSLHSVTGFGKKMKSCARALALKLYKLSFITGRHAKRTVRSAKNTIDTIFNIALSELIAKVEDFARNVSEFKRSRAGRGEVSPTRGIINFFLNVANTFRLCRVAFRRGGLASGFAVAGRVTHNGLAKFYKSKKSYLNYIAPAACIAVLALTIIYWKNSSFALSVTYGGKNLGIVSSEKTFRDAADNVEENVSDASGSNFKLDRSVSYKMVLAKKSDIESEDQLYNNIITNSSNGVASGYGLYVDNRLAGVNSDSSAIQAMLNSITASYKNDTSVQSVGFTQNVSIKNGVFPESVFKSVNELKEIVTAKKSDNSNGTVSARVPGMFRISLDPLYAMNLASDENLGNNVVAGTSQPTLTVKVVKNEVYLQSLPYSVVQVQSNKLKSGKSKVSVEGKNGVKQVVAQVTYVNGVATSQNIISSAVVTQPVNEKVIVGTKGKSSSSSSYVDAGGNPEPSDPGITGGILGYARSALGVRYVPGGSSLSGFDCSGFTSYVFSKYGVSLPHSAAGQSAYGSPVSRSSLQAGDLVFFDTNGGHNNITHVGIYIGGGNFIDASSARPHAVTVDSLNSAYYSSRYMTARRVK